MFPFHKLLAAGAIGLAAIAGLSGCTSSGQQDTATEVAEVAFPNTTYGNQAKWIVDQVNNPATMDADEWDSLMTDKVKESFSGEDLIEILNTDVVPYGPFVVTKFGEREDLAVTELQGQKAFKMNLVLDTETGKMAGLHFVPRS